MKFLLSSTDVREFQADLDVLAKVTVKYETLRGWNSSIANATTYDELPENCKKYIAFIESFLKLEIEWIGVGPGRSSMIRKEGKSKGV